MGSHGLPAYAAASFVHDILLTLETIREGTWTFAPQFFYKILAQTSIILPLLLVA